MFGFSFWEIAMILAVALIFLGPSKLPELAKSFGKSLREFRKATEEFKSTIDSEAYKDDRPVIAARSAEPVRPVEAVIEPAKPVAAPLPADAQQSAPPDLTKSTP